MRQAEESHRRLADRNCPLTGMFVYFYKPLAKESPRLGPLLWKYLNSCFLKATPHCSGNTRDCRMSRMPNDKYAFSESVTVVPKVQWHCR
jgi:hypothetical protein